MSAVTRHAPGLVLGLVLGGFLVGGYVQAERETTIGELPLEELRTFTDVLDRIKRDYVEEVDDKVLLESAIRGMLSGLDPHSSYLDEDAFRELQAGTSGEFGGLGIEVGLEDGFIKVISPIDDTPAQRAGIQAGDLIIRLDETPVKGMNLNDAVKLMRGKPNTEIELTVVRAGVDQPLKIKVMRDVIQVKSVRSRLLEPGFGYVRVTQFQSRSALNLQQSLNELKIENNGPLKGLIMDLRNNPGGVLNAAVEIADTFIDEGLVVYTEGRSDGSQQKFQATPGDALSGVPLIILVNGGSASASEIVAGALQDHRRAIIMGEDTFGKGSVQTILPLMNGTAVKLTTARYYTPKGRSIQAEGIRPDIKLESLQLAAREGAAVDMLREADLPAHLLNPAINPDAEPAPAAPAEGTVEPSSENTEGSEGTEQPLAAPTPAAAPEDSVSLARSDYQLYEALNLLKGLTLLGERTTTTQ